MLDLLKKQRTSAAQAAKLDKVTVTDWLMVVIGLAFTVAGLFIIRKDFNTGIVTLSFFGLCLAASVGIVLRKLRLQKQVPLRATVTGGVPIRQSRIHIGLVGITTLALGNILAMFGPRRDVVFIGVAWLLVGIGSAVLGGLFLRILPVGYIQFDPAGITFARMRGKASVPWTAILHVARGEFHNNQAVFLWVDHEAVSAEPASYLPKVRKQLASSQAWTGADFVILSSAYGIDAPVLLATLERFIAEPASRQELRSAAQIASTST